MIGNTFRRNHRSSRKRPSRTMDSRLRWVAAITRMSTGTARLPPTRSISRFWSTRSRRICAWGGSSPISSRKMVPRLARSKRPRFSPTAPVKAPRSWPNSSESIRCSGMAPQFTLTNGPSR